LQAALSFYEGGSSVAAVATEQSRTQQKKSAWDNVAFLPYVSQIRSQARTHQNVRFRIVVPKVAGSSPVGHPLCANLAFATHCKEAPVFREYGLAPLAHEYGVVTGGLLCDCYNLAQTSMMSESGGMVDTLDLGSSAFGRAGSSPASRTVCVDGASREIWSV
jgi:hypothetical protein